MNTAEIVLIAKQGDDDAFFLLVSTGKERLYSIAIAYLKNEAEALEVIQEGPAELMKNWGSSRNRTIPIPGSHGF